MTICAGEAGGRRNLSGPVNQTDSYAQRPRETVSMSLKEIVSFHSLGLLYDQWSFGGAVFLLMQFSRIS
jgi:hypothetical protein